MSLTLSNYLGLAMELLSPSLMSTIPTQFLSLESFSVAIRVLKDGNYFFFHKAKNIPIIL